MSRTFDADIYRNLVFALPMKEGSGTLAYDRAKSTMRHNMTLTGTPTWTAGGLSGRLQVLDFNLAHPDYLTCAAVSSTDLNFTSGDFSVAVWTYFDAITNTHNLFSRGLLSTDGWNVYVSSNNRFYLVTSQAGTVQYNATATGSIPAMVWQLLVTVRSGTQSVLYKDGTSLQKQDTTPIINPLTSARNTYIGISDALTLGFDGKLWFPRIWSRALTPEEVFYLYQTERGLFGV